MTDPDKWGGWYTPNAVVARQSGWQQGVMQDGKSMHKSERQDHPGMQGGARQAQKLGAAAAIYKPADGSCRVKEATSKPLKNPTMRGGPTRSPQETPPGQGGLSGTPPRTCPLRRPRETRRHIRQMTPSGLTR